MLSLSLLPSILPPPLLLLLSAAVCCLLSSKVVCAHSWGEAFVYLKTVRKCVDLIALVPPPPPPPPRFLVVDGTTVRRRSCSSSGGGGGGSSPSPPPPPLPVHHRLRFRGTTAFVLALRQDASHKDVMGALAVCDERMCVPQVTKNRILDTHAY
jgi:hypothetical protein